MIIIRKKRLVLITSFVLVSIFTFMVSNIKNPNTVETVALPVSNKVIVIDAGHGSPDERGRE